MEKKTDKIKKKKVAIIVAHPDDETLWAGGTILAHKEWKCYIVSLCRKFDTDRAPKFYDALKALSAKGIMGDLNDEPSQSPMDNNQIEKAILKLLPDLKYDILITHSPKGEYTRHLRHEEIGKATMNLWSKGQIVSTELHLFAYEDNNKMYLPKAISTADIYFELSFFLWHKKRHIITKIYGFSSDSWEAQTSPKTEAFWRIRTKQETKKWLK